MSDRVLDSALGPGSPRSLESRAFRGTEVLSSYVPCFDASIPSPALKTISEPTFLEDGLQSAG